MYDFVLMIYVAEKGTGLKEKFQCETPRDTITPYSKFEDYHLALTCNILHISIFFFI